MRKHPTIGVVGGAGPQAGAALVSKIYEESRSLTDQGNPTVHLISAPSELPDRTAFLLGLSSMNPAFGFAKGLCQLAQGGATVAGISCVTAHAPPIYSRIVDLLGTPPRIRLVSMVDELRSHLRRQGYSKVGFLSTLGTYQAGLFADEFAGVSGVLPLHLPEPNQREAVHQAIYSVKASGRQIPSIAARRTIFAAIDGLARMGAEAVVLACTELPLVVTADSHNGLPVIDPIRVLAGALLRIAGEDVSHGVPDMDRIEDFSC